jgi:hypothetical protein
MCCEAHKTSFLLERRICRRRRGLLLQLAALLSLQARLLPLLPLGLLLSPEDAIQLPLRLHHALDFSEAML